MAQFNSNLSGESDQDDSTTATHLCILPQFILKNGTIAPFLTIVWDQTDSCENQYRYASTIYLISCIDLEFSSIIDVSVVAPGHGKDLVDGLNARDKNMLNLSMENILKPKLIRDDTQNASSRRFIKMNEIKL